MIELRAHEAGREREDHGTDDADGRERGPHYGDNVKLAGPGQYKLKLSVAPPGAARISHFGAALDKETGVGAWFKPFAVDYEFAFAGAGKKGGY